MVAQRCSMVFQLSFSIFTMSLSVSNRIFDRVHFCWILFPDLPNPYPVALLMSQYFWLVCWLMTCCYYQYRYCYYCIHFESVQFHGCLFVIVTLSHSHSLFLFGSTVKFPHHFVPGIKNLPPLVEGACLVSECLNSMVPPTSLFSSDLFLNTQSKSKTGVGQYSEIGSNHTTG